MPRRGSQTTGARGHAPRVLIVPAALGIVFLVLPLAALVGRVQWGTLWQDVTSVEALGALRLSLVTGLVATAICLLIGIPLALTIARAAPRTAAVLRAVVTVPLVLPPMVGGLALLFLFGRSGWLGWTGWQVPFTTPAVVLAQVFVALPFLVLALEGAVRTSGVEYERTAAGLGAGSWTILWRVTLPLAGPGLLSGTVLCFARAAGEFGATALFAGNAPGVTQTMPLAIYTAFNGAGVSQGSAIALSLMLLVTSVAVLLLVRGWRPGGGTAVAEELR
ncbi:molybdate ABC transporter permease subunit [Microbacterium arabinogalactanolyticum]|uniref:molybdate ABC transporter permease subunit n=2 Tax=Bacteria TaxID=2 RepID=UPI0025531961|nr:molybdate ABC transporter permease subunit [Microbacterium arabinogalactanolyticum]GLC86027.1 molybdate ABC transporter permease [Microbacterium arabinogalactanolyticum]